MANLSRGLRKLKRYVRDNFETQADAAEYFDIPFPRLKYLLSDFGQRNQRMNHGLMAALHEKTGIDEFKPPENDSKKWHERLAYWVWENFNTMSEAAKYLNMPLNTLHKYVRGRAKNIDQMKREHRLSIYEAAGIEELRPKGYQGTPKRLLDKPGAENAGEPTLGHLMFLGRSRAGGVNVYHAKLVDRNTFHIVEFDTASAGYPLMIRDIFRSFGSVDVVYGGGFDKRDADCFDAFLSSDAEAEPADQQAVIESWFSQNGIDFSDRIAAGMEIAAKNPEYEKYLSEQMLKRPAGLSAGAGV